MKTTRIAFATMALGLTLIAPTSAQLPSASTAALGMGDNFTAAARGYHAVAWNPALLGLRGNPGASLALAPLRLTAGLDPISLKDLKEYEGEVVPDNIKNQWLNDVESEGSEQGSGGVEATYLALQVGPLAFQVSTSARAVANLPPGLVRLLLFGNSDANGNAQSFPLGDGSLDALAVTTLGGSLGFGFGPEKNLAFGVTVKYTMGHLLVRGQNQNSQIIGDPNPAIQLQFPTVTTASEDAEINNGTGIGVDIGVAIKRGNMTIAGAVQNVMNSFEWKTENMQFRPGTALFNADERDGNFDEQPYANAPQVLRDFVDDQKYKPTVSAGVAFMPSDKLTVSADIRSRLGDGGIETGPKFHAGAGAEYRLLGLLPIRAGAALVTDGFQFGGGLGLDLGPFHLSASLLQRSTDLGDDLVTMVTVISTGR